MAVSGSSLLKRIFIQVCQRASHVHVVSKPMKNEIEKWGLLSKGFRCGRWVSTRLFSNPERIEKRDLSEAPMTVLSNRNLLPLYDLSCLIRAIPLVLKEEPEIRFLIAGEGADREHLEREAEHLNVHSSVHFLGRIPHVQMPGLLSKADIYVSTSLADGTSVSLMEAFAAGVFPVVTDIPSNREWITDRESGFLVPVGNERRLADRIIEAIRNEELVEKAGKRNQEIAEKNAYWGKNIHKMVEIYESYLRRN